MRPTSLRHGNWLTRLSRGVLMLAAALTFTVGAIADDWPGWLGPQRDGWSRETGLHLEWTVRRPRLVWTIDLGEGTSAPIAAQGGVWTVVRRGTREFALCHRLVDGGLVWERELGRTATGRGGQFLDSASTPVLQGQRLYLVRANGEVIALEARTGTIVWKSAAPIEPAKLWARSTTEPLPIQSSPLIYGDQLIVPLLEESGATVAALRTKDGQTLWSAGKEPVGQGSITLFEQGRETWIVAVARQSVLGIDPVKGQLGWRYPTSSTASSQPATPLIVEPRVLYVSDAGGASAFEVTRDAQILQPVMAWQARTLAFSTLGVPLLDAGQAYFVEGSGTGATLRCVSLKHGRSAWHHPWGSDATWIGVDGHLLVLSANGRLTSVRLSAERYEEAGRIERLVTTATPILPALSEGRLLVRDQRRLHCLDLREQPAP